MVKPLVMPDFTHVAIFRNAYGDVTHRAFIFLPLGSDGDATMAANGLNRTGDSYCDIFEMHGAHRCGGWHFRKEALVR